MAAYYDSYDYPEYWTSRVYEHESEVFAIKKFLEEIPKIGSILEIGAGFGRLTPYYLHRAKTVVIADPSSKLLSHARKYLEGYSEKKIEFIQSTAENLTGKLRGRKFDLIILIRVLHHIRDVDQIFRTISKLLKKNGYLILEFANKLHWKAVSASFLKGNLTFPLDIFPEDKRTRKKAKSIPFLNYHPDIIREKLEEIGFVILERRSVSNIRSPFFKKYLPLSFLLGLEQVLQSVFSKLNFGPSVFMLSKKRG